MMTNSTTISFADFENVDMRIGRIIAAQPFAQARKPAYQLQIDFGEAIGIKKSSAQITALYAPEQLVGQYVVAVVNFSPKQIANFVSEVLVLGAYNAEGAVVLLSPQREVPLGQKIC